MALRSKVSHFSPNLVLISEALRGVDHVLKLELTSEALW